MKIIASDFDGTLNYHGISAEDTAAIAKFRAAGNKFGIVTGRDLEWHFGLFSISRRPIPRLTL